MEELPTIGEFSPALTSFKVRDVIGSMHGRVTYDLDRVEAAPWIFLVSRAWNQIEIKT
jgi:hypothetical protein